MAFKKNRSMKVYGQSAYRYKETPAIMLKGLWLQELGFEIGDYISVSCENGKLIITLDAERAALAEAEASFMVQETKKLRDALSRKRRDSTRSSWQKRQQCTVYVRRCSDYGKGLYDRIL